MMGTGGGVAMGVMIAVALLLAVALLVLLVLAIVWLVRKLGSSQAKGPER
jgi:flagellar biogenesis protein FliO